MTKFDKIYEFKRLTHKFIDIMQTQAENKLNPLRYHLSSEAKKRLKWMYIIHYECNNNISQAANKIGISRQWLSVLHGSWEKNRRNPKSLEPESKAPSNTNNRQRISKNVEGKIIEIRDKYGWGKESVSVVLKRDYHMTASPSTVNRYFHKHLKIDPKISEKNQKAWLEKKIREELEKLKDTPVSIKFRPPAKLKDYAPGALVEKDMKLVPTIGKTPLKSSKFHIKDHYNYQHTFIDTFTRIRGLELTEEPDSKEAQEAYEKIIQRIPFKIASINTDNGGENGKYFKNKLVKDDIIQFHSRTSTPTDNPRVERSHLTDEKEFYNRGNSYRKFQDQKTALSKWEYTYNHIRPNQALGYLTPMEFYQLWRKNPKQAYRIKDKYKKYLNKQRSRLANSRRIKDKDQIEKLMQFIDAKLNRNIENQVTKEPNRYNEINLEPFKLELIKCQLCSWT